MDAADRARLELVCPDYGEPAQRVVRARAVQLFRLFVNKTSRNVMPLPSVCIEHGERGEGEPISRAIRRAAGSSRFSRSQPVADGWPLLVNATSARSIRASRGWRSMADGFALNPFRAAYTLQLAPRPGT